MVTKTLLETIFPSVIVDNFDIVSVQHYPKDEEIHIHLDEKKTIPVEFSSRRVIFHGFTSAKKHRKCWMQPSVPAKSFPSVIRTATVPIPGT